MIVFHRRDWFAVRVSKAFTGRWVVCMVRSGRNDAAEEIFAAAVKDEDGRASEAVQMFFEILGQFAGDFALALGHTTGFSLLVGIVPRYPQLIANSPFRSGFENKGRCRPMMEKISTQIILHKNPGLLGAGRAVATTMAQA